MTSMPTIMQNALQESVVRPFIALSAFFDSGRLNLWSGRGNRVFNGETFYGTGELLQVDGISATGDLTAQAVTLTLAGQSSTLVSLALQEPYQNRIAQVFFGLFLDDNHTTYSMIELISGFMDRMPISDDGDSSTIALVIEDMLNEFDRSNEERYSAASQKQVNNTDTFFDAMASLQDKKIKWGA